MNRLLRALGVLAALTLACTLLGSGTAVARSADPTVPTQAVGECYALTDAQASAKSLTATAVDCAQRHTSEVIGIGALPSALGWDSPWAKIRAAMRKTCDASLDSR